jgi:murein DD-endopeptidase MepM/ murein hydrolase activator NlpD
MLVCLVIVLMFLVSWITGLGPFAVWWLTNTEPPSISLSGPTGPVRGVVQLDAQLNPADRANIVSAFLDDQSIPVQRPLTIDTAGSADGVHRLRVQAEDTSRLRNRSEAELTLRSDNTPPQLRMELSSDAVDQGGTLLLTVRANEPSTTRVLLDGQSLELQHEADADWAVVGIGPEMAARSIPIVTRATDEAGNVAEQTGSARVATHRFTEDRVQVPQRLVALLEARIRAEEDAQLATTYARRSPVRLWSGPFALPVRGPIITEFGEIRSYNGGPFEGHHAGVDFAVAARTPVTAPARGIVALVDQVALRGNVVILDHGLGVFTTYAHLSSVDVKPGDEIQRGQVFANVGSTGLSEGPHLHWELWIAGQNVDPLPWTRRAFP